MENSVSVPISALNAVLAVYDSCITADGFYRSCQSQAYRQYVQSRAKKQDVTDAVAVIRAEIASAETRTTETVETETVKRSRGRPRKVETTEEGEE